MSDHGAALQTYNQELVKCLEDLKVRKYTLQELIDQEEAERLVLEKNIKTLQEKLSHVNERIAQNTAVRDKYDKIIHDTECGFKKILESSQTLLDLAQNEATRLKRAEDD